jgi:transposase
MIAVGIDVSKSKSTIAILSSTGEILMKPSEFRHDEQELNHLISTLNGYNDEIRVVMEATGHYHYPILKKLLAANLFVTLVNPYLMKKYGDSEIRKGKTDKKDAMRISVYALEKAYSLVPYTVINEKYDDLKFLSRQYNQCISMKIKARVQLSNLLDEIMPGIQNILTSNTADPEDNFLYRFIEKYESFDTIKSLSEKRFISSYIKFAYKSGARNPHSKALKIYELALNSITTRKVNTSTLIAIKNCLQLLKQTESSANAILVQMQSISCTLPEYPVVRAMNGVGDKLAPRLIAEIGDIRRFTSARALNAYAGNDAPPFQSGQYESQNRHISKRGSASLRKAGYEVIQSLKLHKPQSDAVYLFMIKKESEGKPKNVAKMAGLNKFLHIYYARVMEVYK